VLAGADDVSAVDAFRGQHRLAELARTVERVWRGVDVLLLPTTPAAPTVAEMAADPVGLNAVLGRWTTFANLLDLAAVAVPSVLTAAGLPVGVSVLGPAGADDRLLAFAAAWEQAAGLPAAATGHPLLGAPVGPAAQLPTDDEVLVTVVGAHMSGLPLHAQLVSLGARFHAATPTAAIYRLLALPGGPPHRPGLVRVASGGSSVAAETYRLPRSALGDLLVTVPAPLAIGTVELADGTSTLGFVCESLALETARDVTASGGWRAHLASAT
jgi:allophanate hydrolase